MEVLIQWLDELDDLLLGLALVRHRLRRPLLGLGLVASLLVLMPGAADLPWRLALSATALASVAFWSVALLGAVRRPRQTVPASA